MYIMLIIHVLEKKVTYLVSVIPNGMIGGDIMRKLTIFYSTKILLDKFLVQLKVK